MKPSPAAPWFLRHLLMGGSLALLVSTSACSPGLNWRQVQPAQADGLKAMFPCKPQVSERKVPWPGLPDGVAMKQLSCQTEEGTWALSYVTLPEVGLVAPGLQALTDALRRNLGEAARLAAAGGGVREEDLGAVSVPRMTPTPQAHAWRFEAQRPDGLGRPLDMDVRAWHFSHGLTVFQASVWRPQAVVKAQSGEDLAEPFFHGLEFPG